MKLADKTARVKKRESHWVRWDQPPLVADHAEKIPLNKIPDDDLFKKAGEAAAKDDSKPIDGFRGSAGYRRAMIDVLTKRTLK